jgi:hypothetical protein
MTHLFHLAFMGRQANESDGIITFADGLPAPSQQELDDTYDAALQQWNASQLVKVWNNTEEFISEFTLQEMAGISTSEDSTIAALRLLLACWRGIVVSDDPRVVAGLDALVSQNIISAIRRAEIVNQL